VANREQLDILKQGGETWNQWRKEHSDIQPNLSNADLNRAPLSGVDLTGANLSNAHLYKAHLYAAHLSGADLTGADLREVFLSRAHLEETDLSRADLTGADLTGANFTGAHLSNAHLNRADLSDADLTGADLTRAILSFANLREAHLSNAHLSSAFLSSAFLDHTHLNRADLTGADLSKAVLVETDFTGATLNRCFIYGISAWNVKLEGAKQDSLVITPDNEPTITVDNLKIAQFIYLLLNNAEIREVINTLTTKAVLILGRFAPERKVVLDALRDELRTQNYLPILFDFDKPGSRSFTETVRTLAHLARFIIADLTEPSSIPQELQAIIPDLAIPVQPVLLEGKREYAMFVDFLETYPWVLPIHLYHDEDSLLAELKEHVIEPAERKVKELAKLRAQEFEKQERQQRLPE